MARCRGRPVALRVAGGERRVLSRGVRCGDGRTRRRPVLDGDRSAGENTPLDDVLAELPNTVALDGAYDAILAERDYLKKYGWATKADFVRGVMHDYPLGYDPDIALAKLEASEQFRGAWGRRVIKPGLAAFDNVEKPPEGASDWRLVGSEGDT